MQRFIFALLPISLLTADLLAQESGDLKPHLTIPHLENAPVLDGKIGPAEWARATRTTGFLTLAGQLAPLQTTILAGYDAENLYVAFISRCPSPIRKEVTEHDGPVSRDDAFEIYLKPESGTRSYYLFSGNSVGTRFDALLGSDELRVDWNADWRTSSHLEYDTYLVASTWTAEIAIPFASFGLEGAPKTGTRWSANFARDWSADQLHRDAHNGERYTTWARTGGTLHAPDKFGTLVFGGSAPGVQIISLGSLASGLIGVAGNVSVTGETTIQADWAVTTKDKSPREILSGSKEMDFHGSVGQTVSFELDDKLELIETKPLPVILTFQFADADGEVLLRSIVPYDAAPALRAEFVPVFLKDTVWYEFDLSNLPDVADETKGLVEIFDHEGNVRMEVTVQDLGRSKKASSPIDISKLDPGDYRVEISLADESGPVGLARSQQLTIPQRPEWFNNRLGISDNVPPPWSDMVTDGRNVRVGEREYQLGETLLPESMRIDGVEFLAGPIRWNISDGAGGTSLGQTEWRLEKAGAAEAKYTFSAESESAVVRGTLQAEYDGFLLYEVTVDAETIDVLNLEIPLHRKMSPFLRADRAPATPWANEPGQVALIGDVRETHPNAVNPMTSHFGYSPEGWTWGSEFIPQFWVGDDFRGLFCFLESEEDMNWDGQPLEVIHKGSETVLRLNFINQKTVLKRPAHYKFALQATPVKKRDRRLERSLVSEARPEYIFDEYRARPGTITGMVNTFEGRGSTYDYVVGDPVAFRKKIEFYKPIGAEYLICNGASFYLVEDPEYQLYGAEWEGLPGVRYPNYGGLEFTGVNVCPRSSFVDYYLWWLKQQIEEYDIGGIYLDMTGATGCLNKYHGCGYEKDGEWRSTADLFALRNFYKRFYTFLKEEGENRGREFYVVQHSSIYANIPFVDHVFKGEGWASTDEELYDNLTPTYFRAFENQRPIAANYTFYPLVSQPKFRHAKKWATPGDLLSRTLVQDVLCWATSGFHKEMAPIWNAWEDFEIEDAVWVPYFANDPRVQTTSDDLLVSFYTNRDRAIFVVSNQTGNRIQARLKLDRKGLGLPPGTLPAQDILGGQTTVEGPLSNDTLFDGRRFDEIQDSSDKHRYPPRKIPEGQPSVLEGDEFPLEIGSRDLLVLRVN